MNMSVGQSESFNLSYVDDGTGNGNGNNFDYSLSNSGNTTVTKAGINIPAQNTITKTLLHVPAQSVDLNLSIGGSNNGISYAIANSSCSPTCSSTINFTIAPSATVGTHLVTVTGTPKSHTTSFNLIINPSLTIDVTCAATPNSALIGNPVTWNSTVTGTTGTSTYRWSGSGIATSSAPATPSFTTSYSTVGLKTATLTVTDSVGNVGTCNPAGQAQINFNPKFQEF
ncbi:MAG: hypothetical protein JWL80_525 [Parcubacteria group bacterium]|nr:hypothetical protein [Parcubacteria group bacterium]